MDIAETPNQAETGAMALSPLGPGTCSAPEFPQEAYCDLSNWIYSLTGVRLDDSCRPWVLSRVGRQQRLLGGISLEEYVGRMADDASHRLLRVLIDDLFVSHPLFFRRPEQCDLFATRALPDLVAKRREGGQPRLRLWCAGCSTAEEAYTLAMLTHEHLGDDLEDWELSITATDVADAALDRAREGIYYEDMVATVPDRLLRSHFTSLSGGFWRVSDRLRQGVSLLHQRLDDLPPQEEEGFDVIFCRDVWPYCDQSTRSVLASRLRLRLRPGGWLFLGPGEGNLECSSTLTCRGPGVFQRQAAL